MKRFFSRSGNGVFRDSDDTLRDEEASAADDDYEYSDPEDPRDSSPLSATGNRLRGRDEGGVFGQRPTGGVGGVARNAIYKFLHQVPTKSSDILR